ncbi:hypothetical protein HRbin15_02706 [bacterium HR15]|nr:hypothetical protein HRbin15_02706 [bacterium HR15]
MSKVPFACWNLLTCPNSRKLPCCRQNWYLYADGNPVNKVDLEGRTSSAEKAFLGNLLVLFGLLAMGAGVYHLVEDYVKMKLQFQSYLEEEFGKQIAEEMMKRHASKIMEIIFKEMSKSKLNRVAGLLAIWGYFAVVYGQILRTEADQEEPGRYDWWP